MMLDTISPITFRSTMRGANSLLKRPKKASCMDCESVLNRCPYRDDCPSAGFQHTFHFTQCAGAVRKELQPLLAKHCIKCARWGRERRS